MNYDFNMMQNGYTVCPGSWGMADESALFYRMYYIYGGEAYLKQGNEDIPLEKGYFYLFPMMHPYTLWHNPEIPLEVLWFHVEMKMDFYNDFGKVKIERDSVLHSILESIYYLTGKPGHYQELLRLFDIFLTLLNEEIPLHKIAGKKMKKLLEYIDMHIGEELSVQQMADYVGMERSYFSRKFKKIFKLSPRQYVSGMKMSAASKALAEGASVRRASGVAGYTDEKAFSRAFKKYMEISPSDYKKSHIEQP